MDYAETIQSQVSDAAGAEDFSWSLIYVPIATQRASDIASGLNHPLDALLLSVAALCLALSQRGKSVTRS